MDGDTEMTGRCPYCLRELHRYNAKGMSQHGKAVRKLYDRCEQCGTVWVTRMVKHYGYDWRIHTRREVPNKKRPTGFPQ